MAQELIERKAIYIEWQKLLKAALVEIALKEHQLGLEEPACLLFVSEAPVGFPDLVNFRIRSIINIFILPGLPK